MDVDDHPGRIPEDRCAGCGASIGDSYCSKCGQRRARRLTFRRVLSDALEHLLTLDSSFLRTLGGLTKHPGRVGREYVLGQRKTYLNPLKYIFVIGTVYLLVFNFVLSRIPADALEAANEVAKDELRARQAMMPFVAYFGYVIMIPVAAVQRFLFRRQPFGVAECYVFLLFAFGQIMLLNSLFILLPIPFLTLLSPWYPLVVLAYFLWATAGFYRSSKPLTLLRGILVFAAIMVGTVSIFLAVLAFVAQG